MIPEGPEKSSRHLVWMEGTGLGGCSVCSWVFIPSDWPAGKSLDERWNTPRRCRLETLNRMIATTIIVRNQPRKGN
jgi:hypothetical protein